MPTFKQIAEGFFIGSQPSQQNLTHAKQLGIRTVVELRMPGETSASNAKGQNAAKQHDSRRHRQPKIGNIHVVFRTLLN